MKRTAPAPTPSPLAEGGHQTLSAYIQARFDEFSRSQKDVAQYIVDHLDEVAFQTAEELARRANTSSSTVVRFSQALGFEGFPELQAQAREEYRRRVAAGLESHGVVNGNGSSSAATPLFSLDQSEFETARRRRPRQRGGDRAQALALARSRPRSTRSRALSACSSRAPTRWRSSPPTCATC